MGVARVAEHVGLISSSNRCRKIVRRTMQRCRWNRPAPVPDTFPLSPGRRQTALKPERASHPCCPHPGTAPPHSWEDVRDVPRVSTHLLRRMALSRADLGTAAEVQPPGNCHNRHWGSPHVLIWLHPHCTRLQPAALRVQTKSFHVCILPAHLVMGEPPFEAGAWKDTTAVSGVAALTPTARGALGATVPSWNAAEAAERVPRSSLAL